MKRKPLIFIEHILENINEIESFSKELSEKELNKNKLKQYAIIRALEIIGEAVKNLPNNFREKYPDVEWSAISGLRDKLIHHYFGVDVKKILGVIKKDLPKLKLDIKDILKKEKNNK